MIQTHRKKTKFMIQTCRKDINNDTDMQGEDKIYDTELQKDIINDSDMQEEDNIYDKERRYK